MVMSSASASAFASASAIVDVFEALGAATEAELAQPRELLERIVSMLTRLSQD